MKIIIPKRHVPENEFASEAVYFLAGPARGGGDWQREMCYVIDHLDQSATIASPRRWSSSHPLSPFFASGNLHTFQRQLNWEQYYLERAGIGGERRSKGCVVFWLPIEDIQNPHPGPEPYAMDTRGELGEWRMRMKFENARVVVGGHPEFHGLSQIQRNFSYALGYEFPIYDTMERTAQAAVALAHRT